MNYIDKILNIKDFDYSKMIYEIVFDEKNKLLEQVSDLTGFCKYIANQIELRLKEIGVRTYLIDLYDRDIDHVFLICEYRFQNKMVRYLIDPTYIQFTSGAGKTLVTFSKWPGDLLDKKILNELLYKGMVRVDNYVLNNYLNAFNCSFVNIDIDEYLLKIKMNKFSRR